MATFGSTRFSRLFAAVALAMSAAVTVVVDTALRFVGYARDYFTVAVGMFKRSNPHFPEREQHVQERIGLVAAKAYLMRMAQRPRPIDTPLWRMSPVS